MISGDWSSDVCSSDLENGRIALEGAGSDLRGRPEIQESYLGISGGDERRSYRAIAHGTEQ